MLARARHDCLGRTRLKAQRARGGNGPDGHRESKAEFADGFDGARITIGEPALAAATRMPGWFHPPRRPTDAVAWRRIY